MLSIPELIGYLASVIVAVSLMMHSISMLRWYNLAGAVLMSLYGFLIASLPVGLLNLFIALVDIYYLWQIYLKKEYYKLLVLPETTDYVRYFLNFYKKDIHSFFPDFKDSDLQESFKIFVLRDCVPAGLLIGKRFEGSTFQILVEYATPEYRDNEIGAYIYHKNTSFFINHGFNCFMTQTHSPSFEKYIKKMGFSKDHNNIYKLDMTKKW